MDRKIRSLAFLLGMALSVASCGFFGKGARQGETEPVAEGPGREGKPNIVFILADDLGYGDLSCYGQTKFQTPNIDRLASEGMLFTQHYSGSTVCAPSRSALLTGQHTGHTAIRGNLEIYPEGQYPLPDETFTMAEMMKEAGYTTGAFGKWGLGYPSSDGNPLNQGFDTFFGYNCQRFGHHYYPHHLWSDRDSLVLEANSGKRKGTYAPELIHQKTLDFIEDNKDKPFFLYVPSIIPHAELAAPESNMEQFRGKFPPGEPFEGLDSGEKYRKGTYESQAEPRAAFAAMITLLDEQVGSIMKKLEDAGIADNTLVVFTSDNGPHQEGGADPDFFDSNGPLRGHKRDLYEGGIRVPMIVRWPAKIARGSKSEQVSAFWDFFPTFAEIAGTQAGFTSDGVSLLPTFTGNDSGQQDHEYLYWEFHELGGRQAVRMGKWKGVKYEVFKNPDAPMELYDLSRDIGEQENIAEQHPEIVSQLAKIFGEARRPSEVFTFNQKTDKELN